MSDLQIRDLVKRYGQTEIVRATLEVASGELLAVTGAAGSGKSILLRLIAGLESPDTGYVALGGRPVLGIKPVPIGAILPELLGTNESVRDWLELPARQAGIASAEVNRRTQAVAESFGIGVALDRRMSSLDANLRRRVALARAIVAEPEALVIDVDLAKLAPEVEETFLQELLRLRGRRGTAVVYATSDPADALRLGDRIAVLNEGRVEQIGDAHSVLFQPATAEVAQHVRPELDLRTGEVLGERVRIPDLGIEFDVGRVDAEVVVVAAPPETFASEELTDVLLFDADTRENLRARPPEYTPVRLEGAAREAAAEGSEPRYINVSLASGGERLSPSASLRTKATYALEVSIGPYDLDSIVENAREVRWPGEYLPPSDDGYWLELVASSSDFAIANSVERLFLPITGEAWICDCPADKPHQCDPAARRKQVAFSIVSPSRPGTARLRLTAYHELNAVQSLLLTASVGRNRGHRCVIDYSLTAHLAGVGRLRPKALSIVANDDRAGTHTLYVNGRKEEPFSYSLTETQISATVSSAREYLFAAHIVKGTNDKLAYGKKNEKSRAAFVEDLRILASIGYDLLTGAFPSLDKRNSLVARLREASIETNGEAVVQIATTAGSSLAFPWYLVYDIGVSTHAGASPCPFLETWDPLAPANPLPARCPREDAHRAGVLCPYGFWGFAHIIELPPFVDLDVPLRDSIRTQAAEPTLTATLGVSSELDPTLTERHIRDLSEVLGTTPEPTQSAKAILAALEADVDLAYFYCHGETEFTPDGKTLGPLLKLKANDSIRPQDVYASNPPDGAWPSDHWLRTRPLVFINGCHTTSLTPEVLSDFVKAFVGSRAAGVIGTEVSIHQQVANEAAQELVRGLRADGGTVGRSLQGMRRALLAKGNVMGLAYNAYCSEGLTVQPRS